MERTAEGAGVAEPHLYREEDADPAALEGQRVAVVGYGNLGRPAALNLRDSGLEVVVGSREDADAGRAREEGFPLSRAEARVREAAARKATVREGRA